MNVRRYCDSPACTRCRKQREEDAQFAHMMEEPHQYTDLEDTQELLVIQHEQWVEEAILHGD